MLFESLVLNGITTVVALALLIGASDQVVDKLVRLTNAFGVSKTFAGLTVMSLATSLPEIGSHLVASFGILTGSLDYQVASATVLGANIGSDVFQQTFALGLVVLFMGELTFTKTFLFHAYLPMIGTTLMCIILGWDGYVRARRRTDPIQHFPGVHLLPLHPGNRQSGDGYLREHKPKGRAGCVALDHSHGNPPGIRLHLASTAGGDRRGFRVGR